MITLDKIVIRYNRIVRNFLLYLVFWYGSLLFYIFLTGETQLFESHLNLLRTDNIYFIILVLSTFISALFTFLDGVFSDRLIRLFPRWMMVFLKSLLYFATAFILILIAARPPIHTFTQKNLQNLLKHLPDMDIQIIRFLVYFYVSVFLINFLKRVEKTVGRGNFKSWILGLLNKPLEQERIFMFIDMKGSTSLAESLGHRKFSLLIQDVFNDMAVLDNYKGEIYQYLGDGAIVSWNLKDGLNRNNFMKGFYAFKKVIHKKRRYYTRKYGEEPIFKAGAHAGKVMVLQVGQIRRDISYNGDTINTAARIESRCNEYRQELLISGDLYNLLKYKNGFDFKNAGKIKLTGKKRGIDIYKVKQKK